MIVPILVLLTSIIYGLPHLILANDLGSSYDPISLSVTSPIARDEVFAYAPMVNFILNGNFPVSEIYVKEFEDFPTPFLGETLPATVMAFLARATGSIPNAFLAADFIFPPIVFVLLYLFSSIFLKNKLYAAAASFLAVIARDFVAIIPNPIATLNYLTVPESQTFLLYFARAFHPQVTFIFFISAILSLFKLLKKPQEIRWALLLGILFGLLFYSYLFYWTYFILFFALIFFSFARKLNFPVLKSLTIAGMIAAVIASYYLANIYSFNTLDIAQDFIKKTALHGLPLPLTIFRYLALGAALFFLFRKSQSHLVFALLVISGVLVSLISKFTIGQDLEIFHYLRRALMPFATIALFVMLHKFLNIKKTLTILSFGIIILGITFGIRNQVVATGNIAHEHKTDKNLQEVFNWFQANTAKESVIASLDTDFNSLVPVYTQNKVYFPPTDRTIMTTDEGVDRFLIIANLQGIDLQSQKNMLEDKSLLSYLFVYQAYENNKLSSESLKKQMAVTRAQNLYPDKWQEQAQNTKLDYLVISPKDLGEAKPNRQFLKPVTSVNGYVITKYEK